MPIKWDWNYKQITRYLFQYNKEGGIPKRALKLRGFIHCRMIAIIHGHILLLVNVLYLPDGYISKHPRNKQRL